MPAERRLLSFDQRCRCPEFETRQAPQLLPGEQHEPLRQKRAMHNETRVAFDLARIVAIIMYPVAIEGQRGIAEQIRLIEPRRFAVLLVTARALDRGGGSAGDSRLAIDEILPVGDTKPSVLMNVMPQRDKGQRPAAPVLASDLIQNPPACGRHPGPQCVMKGQPPAGPHPARQPHVGDQIAQFRVPVRTQPVRGQSMPEIKLMKERRQWITCGNRRLLPQHRLHRAGAGRVHHIVENAHRLVHSGRLGCNRERNNPEMPPKITALDHLVLTVTDLERTLGFYSDILALDPVKFTPADGAPRWALAFGRQKINLHVLGAEFEPKATLPTAGSADICLLSDTPIEIWLAHLESRNVIVEDGPVARSGATGSLLSIYLRDPDGNLIEIANQTG